MLIIRLSFNNKSIFVVDIIYLKILKFFEIITNEIKVKYLNKSITFSMIKYVKIIIDFLIQIILLFLSGLHCF